MRWRAPVPMPSYCPISDAAPGTTCGNHRAHFPRHLRTSPGMVFAVQLHELTPEGWTRSLIHFALQARSRWFEPTCAHQVFAARWPFETLIGGQVTTAGNHRCMLPDGKKGAQGPWQHHLRSPGRALPASTAGTTGIAGSCWRGVRISGTHRVPETCVTLVVIVGSSGRSRRCYALPKWYCRTRNTCWV
jgi:hypothetical protein